VATVVATAAAMAVAAATAAAATSIRDAGTGAEPGADRSRTVRLNSEDIQAAETLTLKGLCNVYIFTRLKGGGGGLLQIGPCVAKKKTNSHLDYSVAERSI
jgi:hypothetical protein